VKGPKAKASTEREEIPEAVVRQLVQHNERKIDALGRELDAELRRAAEAERNVADLLGARHSTGSDPTPGEHGGRPPRTTVVTRPASGR
jgi:hypothetical protein